MRAQARRPLIGYLHQGTPETATSVEPFVTGMAELGYREGRDFDIVFRFANNASERLPGLAQELARLAPDILVGQASLPAVALALSTPEQKCITA